ncbi:MAG: AIR synthase related protein [Solirubrobacterales bacterium]
MGEFELLAKLRERLPPGGPRLRLGSGDDAAVTVPGGATATSVDALVDGVHFRRRWSSPAQIGHKALAAALSDLAAMGAEPGEAYVVLGVPTDLEEDECIELTDGMSAVAAETGTALAGGDVTRAPALTLAMTVVGHAPEPAGFVTRGGGRPGDVLAVTGELGGAAAGLLLLEQDVESRSPSVTIRKPACAAGERRTKRGKDAAPRSVSGAARRARGFPDSHSVPGGERTALLARQLEPWPRIAAGQALAAAGASAMIDLSDGLGGDAEHLAAASGVGLEIEAAALPVAAGVAAVAAATSRDPLELAAAAGEDYELLVALPAERFEAAVAAVRETGTTLTRIGAVAAGDGVEIRLPDGRLSKPAGFDQLG